ncbi:uncharacterized protein LOC126984604 [Eriocheir sinensis]|uniref:uncharacterized protein LOC126984604 n=1 Tax=Eriocheir sinensis TaxID=95602 RepID=UPI0021C7396C|nr:uncharacterized protein LOC126984604 [Eriocheir sinensis]
MAKLLESSHHWMGTSMAGGETVTRGCLNVDRILFFPSSNTNHNTTNNTSHATPYGGGSVFPTMFADTPAEAPVPAASSPTTTTTTAVTASKLLPPQKFQTSSVALTRGEDSAANLTRSTSDGGGGGPPPTDAHPSPATSTPSSSTAVTKTDTNTSITNMASTCIKNHKKPSTTSLAAAPGEAADHTSAVLALASHFPGSVKASRGRVSPTPGMVVGGAVASAGVLTSSRDEGGGGVRAVECSWDDLRGAISAPKSGASRWTQNDLMAALTLVKAGTPIKPAAERCNIPVMTLWRRTRALGIVSSKVQCGFRYPAARRRPRADQESGGHAKTDAELNLPVKTEADPFPVHKTEADVATKNQSEGGFLRCPSASWTVATTRAGPLREMTVHAPRRLASRESSPRPTGRENSPLPAGKACSSRAAPTSVSVTQTTRKSYRTTHEGNTTTAEQCSNPPQSVIEDSQVPQDHAQAEPDAALNPASEGKSRGSQDAARDPAARSTAGGDEGDAVAVPQLLTTSSSGRSERFRAWVDIVLEGAGNQKHQQQEQQQQQETPQDLSTHHQRPSVSITETSTLTTVVATTTSGPTAAAAATVAATLDTPQSSSTVQQ